MNHQTATHPIPLIYIMRSMLEQEHYSHPLGNCSQKHLGIMIKIMSRTFVNKHSDVTAMTMDVPLMHLLHKGPSI